MPIAGLGLYPVGFNPLGFGYETPPDEATEATGVRFLDPRTGDYARDTDNELARSSTALQRVVIALTTRFGSSMAVRGFQAPERHDQTTQQITNSEVRTCLAPMVSDGSIVIDRIVVRTEADRVVGRLGVDVEFFDLSTGEREVARV